ncbi:alpha/beta hydrolase [Ketobacter sp.]|uniref:alpha/beta hydrolase n=1 Tax=Ketobacter sp. TaxID=2083498 RepID=UPI000F166382|nr:alpha/beta hydrolase [Ketobacter sp.]RLU00349.1 MAG: alpha/beta hydrolase [Ketobacter sp.]
MTLIEKAKSHALRTLLHLPRFAKRRLVGEPIRVDGLELDLDMQLLVKLSNLEPPVRPSRHDPRQLHASRRAFNATTRVVQGKVIPMNTRDMTLGRSAPHLPGRLYTPEQAEDLLLIYFHGGGWVHGNLDTHDNLCRHLARVTRARVLSVEYQKAPENPWPTPVLDVMRAYEDIVTRFAELGLQQPVIAVAGDSAGGKLATVLARKLSTREDLPIPSAQLLIYPSADSPREVGSRQLFADGFLLTDEGIRIYKDCYIPPEQDQCHPDISPLYADDLHGSPAAVVATAGFDPLRDEGRDYAKKLQASGVDVEWIEFPGLVHGFANILCSQSALNAVETMAGALRQKMLQHA